MLNSVGFSYIKKNVKRFWFLSIHFGNMKAQLKCNHKFNIFMHQISESFIFVHQKTKKFVLNVERPEVQRRNKKRLALSCNLKPFNGQLRPSYFFVSLTFNSMIKSKAKVWFDCCIQFFVVMLLDLRHRSKCYTQIRIAHSIIIITFSNDDKVQLR